MSLHLSEINRLVLAHRAEDPLSSETAMLRLLRTWWCLKYDRPFKDPLLDTYTPDDLAYEFYFHHYQNPDNAPEKVEQDSQEKKEDDEWVKKQLEKVKEENAQAAENKGEKVKRSELPEIPELPEGFEIPEELQNLPEFQTKFDEL